jgi:hypothetical protein
MALHWSWAFGPEDHTDLTAMGFGVTALATANAPDSSNVYTYTGSPTRYSWSMETDQATSGITLPGEATAGLTEGWVQAPFYAGIASGYDNWKVVISVTGGGSGRNIRIDTTSTGALTLYVDNTFKASTQDFDFSSWKVIALQWSMTTSTWKGRIWVDGVAATAEYTDPRVAETSASIRLGPGPGQDTSGVPAAWLGQIIVWDDWDDSGQTPYFVTRAEPASDGTNIGTWTPSTGSDDFAVVDSPFDTATYTQEASPAASDRCEVVTSSIATATGITPGTIAGVTAHTYSEGQAITAKAVVSVSGGSEASGSSVGISASATTYATATDTAAYSGTDTIDVIYEVVST